MTLQVPLNVSHRPSPAAGLRQSVEHEDDLATFASSSRRNSECELATLPSESRQQLALVRPKLNPSLAEAAEDVKSSDHFLHEPDVHQGLVHLYAGKSHRQFSFRAAQLLAMSPYVAKLLAENEGHDGSQGTPEQETFEDIDEFAMALFHHWLEDGGKLAGPHDFHSTQHYLGLYLLARKFGIESLENQVMDVVRHYYAVNNMSAPAFRIEYIYAYSSGPNAMRGFLLSTAAYRALDEVPQVPGVFISDSMRDLLLKNGEIALDFISAAIALHKADMQDVRRSADCEWHVHEHTTKCEIEPPEAWRSD